MGGGGSGGSYGCLSPASRASDEPILPLSADLGVGLGGSSGGGVGVGTPGASHGTLPDSTAAAIDRSLVDARDNNVLSGDGARRQFFSCKHCALVCPLKSKLNYHMMVVHGVGSPGTKGEVAACGNCDSAFSSKSDLRKHFRSVHEKERRYSCESCESAFFFRKGMVEQRSAERRKEGGGGGVRTAMIGDQWGSRWLPACW